MLIIFKSEFLLFSYYYRVIIIINLNFIFRNSSVNLSSDSSVDEEYVLGNLNTLLQKKGIIDSNKEWPMFKHVDDDDNDDDRSLTDQLLDIYPCSSYDR